MRNLLTAILLEADCQQSYQVSRAAITWRRMPESADTVYRVLWLRCANDNGAGFELEDCGPDCDCTECRCHIGYTGDF